MKEVDSQSTENKQFTSRQKDVIEEAGVRSKCPISIALDLLGDKWTILILRDMLIFGKQYYGDFLKSGEHISTNLLADRLKRLERWKMVTREVDAENAAKVRYQLTEKGRQFAPVLVKLLLWSGEYHEAWLPEGMEERLEKDPMGLERDLLQIMMGQADSRDDEE
ncbi:HTH-type transcriptional regulator YodB [Poriferisphaera corsica]|uniref:HTH-type transcriptional regulator YodB n=1 Tax=Poriferisphaera corsica TaxID=2528020 RepID=A0A517YPK1_9BACT|nr:helix-turn-helix domain-containing protein [Poriferisphaera corsica]QDU32148.1 HTH-type transcriptional regulator YodB [Poriferisphaera corsica]